MFFWAKDWPIESIESHTLNLIKNFNKLKVLYPGIKYLNWDLLELACIYHDMGKINTKFQNKLVNNIIKTKGIGKNKMKLWQDFNEEQRNDIRLRTREVAIFRKGAKEQWEEILASLS